MVAALVLLGPVAACGSSSGGHEHDVGTCRPVFFGVAGSGQGVQNPPPTEVPAGLNNADADSYGTTIGLLKKDLMAIAGHDLVSASAIGYPATPVRKYIGRGGLIGDLEASEQAGVRALVDAIRQSYENGCAARPVLLAGYSQGAEVVIRAVDELTAAQQTNLAVALFGNPSYLPGQLGDYPGHTTFMGVRPSLEHDAFRLPTPVRARTIDVCAPGDGVCGVDPAHTTLIGKLTYAFHHIDVHLHAYAFGNNDYLQRAAQFLWQHR